MYVCARMRRESVVVHKLTVTPYSEDCFFDTLCRVSVCVRQIKSSTPKAHKSHDLRRSFQFHSLRSQVILSRAGASESDECWLHLTPCTHLIVGICGGVAKKPLQQGKTNRLQIFNQLFSDIYCSQKSKYALLYRPSPGAPGPLPTVSVSRSCSCSMPTSLSYASPLSSLCANICSAKHNFSSAAPRNPANRFQFHVCAARLSLCS